MLLLRSIFVETSRCSWDGYHVFWYFDVDGSALQQALFQSENNLSRARSRIYQVHLRRGGTGVHGSHIVESIVRKSS
jgi:hypothetical protein